MSFSLILEPWLDEGRQVMRSTIVEGELSGLLSSPSKSFLVVTCPRAFPTGARVRFKWNHESGSALVEDCIHHASGYMIWLEVQRAARWLAPSLVT